MRRKRPRGGGGGDGDIKEFAGTMRHRENAPRNRVISATQPNTCPIIFRVSALVPARRCVQYIRAQCEAQRQRLSLFLIPQPHRPCVRCSCFLFHPPVCVFLLGASLPARNAVHRCVCIYIYFVEESGERGGERGGEERRKTEGWLCRGECTRWLRAATMYSPATFAAVQRLERARTQPFRKEKHARSLEERPEYVYTDNCSLSLLVCSERRKGQRGSVQPHVKWR